MTGNVWTRFWDMSSGGREKLDWPVIYIEAADEDAAVERFQREFGRDPSHVTCDCCGEDFAVCTYPTLEDATFYHRRQGRVPLDQYDAKILPAT